MNVAYIINHRGIDSFRKRNLELVVSHVRKHFPDVEILIVEQTPSLTIDAGYDKKIVFEGTAHFRRCLGFNVGYRNTDAEILIFADNDIILSPRYLTESIEHVMRSGGSASPYHSVYDLFEVDLNNISFLINNFLPISRPSRSGFYAGGVVILHRGVFEKLGGWDERFVGWGGEDDQFNTKLIKLKVSKFVNQTSFAYHLPHPKANHSANPFYANNVELWRETERILPEHLEVMCSEQLKMIGKVKYDKYCGESK
jgi:hypothetical protein